MDFTNYLPEKLKDQYDSNGTAGTVLEKVLEMFSQMLSGDVTSVHDFQAKIDELQYFWDSYEVEDLVKLKRVLDPQNIIDKIIEIREVCSVERNENQERIILMTIPLFNKMKGTIVGLTNVLKMFGIVISIIPWYDPNYPRPNDPECSVIISTFLENGCLSPTTNTLIEEIVKSLLDVCVIISVFEMVKMFETQIPIDETLVGSGLTSYCAAYDWRVSRNCCDLFGIANVPGPIFYADPTGMLCDGQFNHSGSYEHKCRNYLSCVNTDRADLAITDPISRCYSEVSISQIELMSDDSTGSIVRYTLTDDVSLNGIVSGDFVFVSGAYYEENNGELEVFSVNNTYNWIEVINDLRTDSSKNEVDSTGSEALLCINNRIAHNRDILSYLYPTRVPVYDHPLLLGLDLGDSIGAYDYTANEFVGSNWLKAGNYLECPDTFGAYYSILNDDRTWTLRITTLLDEFGDPVLDEFGDPLLDESSDHNEYYLILEDSTGIEPFSEPSIVLENEIELVKGTVGSLNIGEWGYSDLTVGYSTIFIRLNDDSSPNTHPDNYLEAGIFKDYCLTTIVTHGPDNQFLVAN